MAELSDLPVMAGRRADLLSQVADVESDIVAVIAQLLRQKYPPTWETIGAALKMSKQSAHQFHFTRIKPERGQLRKKEINNGQDCLDDGRW